MAGWRPPAAAEEAIKGDLRRLIQARGRQATPEERAAAQGLAIVQLFKDNARARCRVKQGEYRAIANAYASPRRVVWPRCERPGLECVFVEFRVLPHARALLINAIQRLRCDFAFVCGHANCDFVEGLLATIDYPVRLVKLDFFDVDVGAYSALLASAHFWRRLRGEYVLIHQEDAVVFDGRNVDDILARCDRDGVRYLGAPWRGPQVLDVVVGNGGFSLRHRETMLDLVRRFKIIDFPKGEFAFHNPSQIHPEDIYFVYHLRTAYPQPTCGPDGVLTLATMFSTESVPDGGAALGGHQFWLGDEDGWRARLHATLEETLGPPAYASAPQRPFAVRGR